MVRVLGFLGFRDSMFAGLREEGWGEESTGGGPRCVGGRQGGEMPPAGVVVAGGWAWSRAGASPSERLGERGEDGASNLPVSCKPRGSSGRLAGRRWRRGSGGGGGGGTWPRRVSFGTWRTVAAEPGEEVAAGAAFPYLRRASVGAAARRRRKDEEERERKEGGAWAVGSRSNGCPR
jgi:hypothetical protein